MTINKITPEMSGNYIITTRNTLHKWNMVDGTIAYSRHPMDDSNPFWSDGEEYRITTVIKWPEVGKSFGFYFDDPETPLQLEHWRVSSTIKSIERVE
jgi:hypothetical protein